MANPGITYEIRGNVVQLEKALKKAANANDNLSDAISDVGSKAQQAGAKGSTGINKLADAATKAKSKLGDMFKDASKDFDVFNGKLNGLISSSHKFGGVVAGAGVAIVGLGAAMLAASNNAAELKGLSLISGTNVEDLQKWTFVAKNFKIQTDTMVDGLKELNLRADEFVLTGKGSAAESFERLGYSAEEVAQKIKKPSDFLLEIIGRIRQLDASARTRVLDEMFGGSAAEQFSKLLGVSQETLKEMVETGPVISQKDIEILD